MILQLCNPPIARPAFLADVLGRSYRSYSLFVIDLSQQAGLCPAHFFLEPVDSWCTVPLPNLLGPLNLQAIHITWGKLQMADLGISEFSFGYAFLFEQTQHNWGALAAAPVLPSLQQEANVGWDVHLPLLATDFYYQFKVSKRMIGRNARFRANGTYDSPYYQLDLHRRDFNRQHRTLWHHAQSHPNTYYVAPELETADDFSEAFLANTITENSRLIPLTECDTYSDGDGGQHWITFSPGADFIQHSKKRFGKARSGKELVRVYEESRQRWQPVNEAFSQRVLNDVRNTLDFVARQQSKGVSRRLLEGVRASLDRPVGQRRELALELASKALSVVLGVTLVLVGERE